MPAVFNIMYSNGNVILNGTIAATSCLGPLTATNNGTVSDGDSAELSCSLPAPSNLPITGGSWRRKTPDVILAALMREQSVVKWNSTTVSNKVSVSDQNLNPDFNMKLKKVKTKNAYCVCPF